MKGEIQIQVQFMSRQIEDISKKTMEKITT